MILEGATLKVGSSNLIRKSNRKEVKPFIGEVERLSLGFQILRSPANISCEYILYECYCRTPESFSFVEKVFLEKLF